MGTDIVLASDLIRHNEILKTVKAHALTHDLCQEDVEKEKARWAAGGTKGDLAVVAAIEAVNEGRVLVDLSTVIAAGGISQKHHLSKLPGLTFAPPWALEVSMRVRHDGDMTLRTRRGLKSWRHDLTSGYTFPHSEAISYSAVATVPRMPPEIRAVAHKDHVVLWEPDWRKAHTKVQRPPLDPALLERLDGNLYMVVATWDLSPLEAAALGG